MDRTKEFITLAPFVALAIAVSYLQGYWGVFEILAFPYLTFQELLAYSAAPLFGFLFFALVGMSLGALNSIANRRATKSKWNVALEDLAAISITVLAVYFDRPEKWLLVLLLTFGLISPFILRTSVIQRVRESNPSLLLSAFVMVFLLFCSFGYGRAQAERLIRQTEPNVRLSLEAGTERGRLIGKLGSYYFFLSGSSHVNVLPEQSVKRIEYNKVINGD